MKVGDKIERGQVLLVLEAAEMVQAQSDLIAATAAMNKARATLNFAWITEKRNRDLYDAKAVPFKDVQQAQAAVTAAQNDLRSAETGDQAARNRLRILGCTDDEITTLLETGQINAEAPVYAPIGGTVVQRKVGPGQYVNASASDPVFLVGDLSTVWLTAFVRETEALRAEVGQDLRFTVQVYPNHVSERRSSMSRRPSILRAAGASCGRRSTIPTVCSSLRCLPPSQSIEKAS
jgi:membrane fusion protein, heavy metal efflux system